MRAYMKASYLSLTSVLVVGFSACATSMQPNVDLSQTTRILSKLSVG